MKIQVSNSAKWFGVGLTAFVVLLNLFLFQNCDSGFQSKPISEDATSGGSSADLNALASPDLGTLIQENSQLNPGSPMSPQVGGGAAPSDDLLDWLEPSFGADEAVLTRAETKLPLPYDPQFDPHDINSSNSFKAVVNVEQVFRTRVDRALGQIHFRKDVPGDRVAPGEAPADYYGEIWNYDDTTIQLRSETFFAFPDSVSPGEPKAARADKFRFFRSQEEPSLSLAYSKGRHLAFRKISRAALVDQRHESFACFSYQQLRTSSCPRIIGGFRDRVGLETVPGPFNVQFDGVGEGGLASEELRTLDRVVVIVQENWGTAAQPQSRERFFFGFRKGRYFGLVRWDSMILKDSVWTVHSRTIGLRVARSVVTYAGMIERGRLDHLDRVAGLRVLEARSEGAQSCPPGHGHTGEFTREANLPSQPHHAYDVGGFETRAESRLAVCSQTPAHWKLVEGTSCPSGRQRGSIFISRARVPRSPDTAQTVDVRENWVVLCAPSSDDLSVALVLGGTCPQGLRPSGSFMNYKDCYVANGQRCRTDGTPEWITLCSR